MATSEMPLPSSPLLMLRLQSDIAPPPFPFLLHPLFRSFASEKKKEEEEGANEREVSFVSRGKEEEGREGNRPLLP